MAAAILLFTLSACGVDLDIPSKCTKAELKARPARAANLASLVLEAQLTANGKPVPGVQLDFWLESKPNEDPTANMAATTGPDGVARAQLDPLKQQSPYYESQARKMRYFVAILDSRFVPHGYTGPVYCSTRDHAKLTLTELQ